MHSKWNDQAAAQQPDELAVRVYSSRLLGGDPALVLHGGGNTSLKLTERDIFGDPIDLLYAPPPAPVATAWHIAENGATKGPFGDADLSRMVAAGGLTRSTLVWTAGQDGWKPAGDTALAAIFAMVPPPPPTL